MLAEAMMLGQITGGNPARQLGAKPEVVKLVRARRAAVERMSLADERRAQPVWPRCAAPRVPFRQG